MCASLSRFVASPGQFDSPVLLWTGCDNEALAAICNPAFHAVLRVIHHNHGLTNQLGEAFTQLAKIKESADSNTGAKQLLSAATDCVSSLPLCSRLQVCPGQTWQRTFKIMQMEKRSATQSGRKHVKVLLMCLFPRIKACSHVKIQKL